MGTWTNATIGYGIILDEGFEFPWNKLEFDTDPLTWWQKNNNYKNPFDGSSKAKDFKRDWEEKYPIPFEVENYCSWEDEMYTLLVPGTIFLATRGNPEIFDPVELKVNDESLRIFLEFLNKYKIPHGEPGWILFSYWG